MSANKTERGRGLSRCIHNAGGATPTFVNGCIAIVIQATHPTPRALAYSSLVATFCGSLAKRARRDTRSQRVGVSGDEPLSRSFVFLIAP